MKVKQVLEIFADIPKKKHLIYTIIIISLFYAIFEFLFVISIGFLLNPNINPISEISSNLNINYIISFVFIMTFVLKFAHQVITLKVGVDLSNGIGAKIIENLAYTKPQIIKKIPLNDWINNILVKSNIVIYDLILPAISIVHSATTLLLVSCGILYLNGFTGLGLLIPLILCYFCISNLLKNNIKNNAEVIAINNSKLIKIVRDIYSNKEFIWLSNKGHNFSNTFKFINLELKTAQGMNLFYYQAPRLFIEPILYFFLFIFILGSVEIDTNEILIVLLGLTRLVGPLQSIISSISTMRSSIPSVKGISSVFYKITNSDQLKIDNPSLTANIKTGKLNFLFSANVNGYEFIENGKTSQSFIIKPSEWIGLIGASGVGKTTFIETILGMRNQAKIYSQIDRNKKINIEDLSKYASYARQNSTLYEGNVIENITLFEDIPDAKKANLALKTVGLMGQPLGEFYYNLKDIGENISGGQLQRLIVARALYLDRIIMFLDEATGALDATSEKNIYEAIKRNYPDLAVILITHNKENNQHCDTLIHLKRKF